MNKLITLAVLLTLTGCDRALPIHALPDGGNSSMGCDLVDDSFSTANVYRCENDEVICYIMSGYQKGGISCEFKVAADADKEFV